MGYSEFGGGGSVSWTVDHEGNSGTHTPGTGANKETKGHDPIPRADMGLKKGAPSGHFRVEVMYDSPADADAARKSVTTQGSSLVLFVKSNTGGGNGPYPPQIRVSW